MGEAVEEHEESIDVRGRPSPWPTRESEARQSGQDDDRQDEASEPDSEREDRERKKGDGRADLSRDGVIESEEIVRGLIGDVEAEASGKGEPGPPVRSSTPIVKSSGFRRSTTPQFVPQVPSA